MTHTPHQGGVDKFHNHEGYQIDRKSMTQQNTRSSLSIMDYMCEMCCNGHHNYQAFQHYIPQPFEDENLCNKGNTLPYNILWNVFDV